MAKSVFYSFHYERDVARVQLVEKINALEGQPILNAQEWETVEGAGSDAVREWIDEKMKYKKAVIVLIGRETARRPWVKYEIEKAWADKRPLLGIRIHGLSSFGSTDSAGPNPFDVADVDAWRIPVFDPTVTSWNGTIDSRETYAVLVRNLEGWSDQGVTRS